MRAFVADLPAARPARRGRAIALGQRRARLVLLLRARRGRDRAQDGLLPHHRDDVAPSRAQHGLLRPAVPEPGHDAARRLRQPDRTAAPARAAAAGELGLPRRRARAVSRRAAVGLPRVRASGSTAARSSDRADEARAGRFRDRRSDGGSGGDDEDAAPWTRPPSGPPRMRRDHRTAAGASVRAVLAQRLFVEKAGLPSPLLNQIKRLAAFQNPEFYKKQSMRLSTALTPRVIACAEDLPQHVALPRGCRPELEELLRGLRRRARRRGRARDRRAARASLPRHADGGSGAGRPRAPRARHRRVRRAAGRRQDGRRHVPGRGARLQHAHPRPPQPLLDQWLAQLSLFLGIEPKEIGQIGGGKRNRQRPARRGDDPEPRPQGVRRRPRRQLRAGHRGRVPPRPGGLLRAGACRGEGPLRRRPHGDAAAARRAPPDPEMQLGPVRFAVDPKSQARASAVRAPARRARDALPSARTAADAGIQELYAALARGRDAQRADPQRRHRMPSKKGGRRSCSPSGGITSSTSRAAANAFARHLVVLHGGMGAKATGDVRDSSPRSRRRRSGSCSRRGGTSARASTTRASTRSSWRCRCRGRARSSSTPAGCTGCTPARREVRIYDYVDREVPMLLRMFEKRLRGYRAIGYARGEAPLGYAEPRKKLGRVRRGRACRSRGTTTLLERNVHCHCANQPRRAATRRAGSARPGSTR